MHLLNHIEIAWIIGLALIVLSVITHTIVRDKLGAPLIKLPVRSLIWYILCSFPIYLITNGVGQIEFAKIIYYFSGGVLSGAILGITMRTIERYAPRK